MKTLLKTLLLNLLAATLLHPAAASQTKPVPPPASAAAAADPNPIELKTDDPQYWHMRAAQSDYARSMEKVNEAIAEFKKACAMARDAHKWPEIICNLQDLSVTKAPVTPAPDPPVNSPAATAPTQTPPVPAAKK